MVFTLTRFFRDGGNRGPTKLELSRTEEHLSFNGINASLYVPFIYSQHLLKICLSRPDNWFHEIMLLSESAQK